MKLSWNSGQIFAICLCIAVFLGLVGKVQAAAAALPSTHKPNEEYTVKLCVVSADISWDTGRDWRYRNDFFLKYLYKIKPTYRDEPFIKYVDFKGFNKVTFLMAPDFCHAKRYEFVRNIFNELQGSKDHPAVMRRLDAAEEYVSTIDHRGVSGGMFKDDYVRTLSPEVIKKCLYVAEVTDFPSDNLLDRGPYLDDQGVYFVEMNRIFLQYAFPFIDATKGSVVIKSKEGINHLLSGNCQNGMDTINNLLYWTSKLTRGKIKQTTLRFIKDPDPQKYLDGLSTHDP
jgi:hypothetical protein